MTALILTWQQAFEAGVLICGGKGYHLAKLQRYGFPVPVGGVVVADVYRQLIHAPALAESLETIRPWHAEDVMAPAAQEALRHVRQGITATVLPMQVRAEIEHFLQGSHLGDRSMAVRSSAVSEDGPNASFAGIHRSILPVQGVEAICHAILQCFASLWTPTAVAYRRRLGYVDDDVLCAVVLCAMVTTPAGKKPQSAGVAFSGDPRSGRRDLIVINAAPGSGEPMVSGAVDPDHIEIRQVRGRLHLHRRLTPGAPVLTSEQELELASHVWRVHWALGDGDRPQDVEWAHDGTQFWILQARPVTRLPHHTFEAVKHLPVIWSTANIKDAVPGVVSMFAWSLIIEAIDGILYAGQRSMGYEIPHGMQTIKRIDGHAYFDLTALQWCWYDFAGTMPAQTVATIGGHHPEIPVAPVDPLTGSAGRRRKKTRLQLLWRMLRFNRRARRVFQEHLAEIRTIAALPWTTLGNGAMLQVMARMVELHARLDPVIGFSNGYASAFKNLLDMQLRDIAGERAPGLMARLLAGSGEITSAEQGYRIADLAGTARRDPVALAWLQRRETAQTWETLPSSSPFRHELARFLDDFGHRAVYEADVINPRWYDDPGCGGS